MSDSPHSPTRVPLRLWPGVSIAVLILVARFVLPALAPGMATVGVLGGAVGALLVLAWWLVFSRAPWVERLGAIGWMALALLATRPLLHESIVGAGMGMLIYILAIPLMCVALVAWAVACRRLTGGLRHVSMAAALFFTCGGFTLVRTGGINGEGGSDLHWRWTPTPEDRLLSRATPAPQAEGSIEPASPLDLDKPADWPGFRGPGRDGVIHGVRIESDWSKTPPVLLWRAPIGPGWSSFAADGELCYTQEQRGEEEIVACYRVSTGEAVWMHRDPVRFWESNAGAGPRGTPTLIGGRVYAFGGTGLLNALDAASGAVLWSRNAAADGGKAVPTWGFSSSPLVVEDELVLAVAGKLLAYDLATGQPRWSGPDGGGSYSSPQLATIDGVPQVLLMSDAGTTSVALETHAVLWEHAWSGGAIVQPALLSSGDILVHALSMSGGLGLRRLAVHHDPAGWRVEERWTSKALKPYYNDFVVHAGHAYGLDGTILACLDLDDGERQWKDGRYGAGQLVLFEEQELLLVLSEEGELALVAAKPDQYRELARVPAIQGKAWNHPAFVRDVLLVRSDEQMAAFRLPLASR